MIAIKKNALLCIERVLHKSSTFDEAFELICSQEPRLNEQRAMIYELGLGVLRTKDRLEFYIQKAELKKKPKGHLKTILYLAFYQITFQDRSELKKIIYEAVELTKILCSSQEASFVNFLLRNKADLILRIHQTEFKGLKGSDRKKYLCLGDFIYQKLSSSYSPDSISKFSEQSLQRPSFYCRYLKNEKSLNLQKKHLMEDKILKTDIPGCYEILDFDVLNEKWGFFIQDAAFQRILLEFESQFLNKNDPKLKILDLCAAPGGKSFFLSHLGYDVIATDYNPKRLILLNENKMNLSLPVHTMDYEKVMEQNDFYDCVLLDAPCTSTGTLRKNPEVRWNKTQKELESLLSIQQELLEKSSLLIHKNGMIFYSVCSVLKEEGEQQIKKFLSKNSHFQLKKEWVFEMNKSQSKTLEDGHYAAILQHSGSL